MADETISTLDASRTADAGSAASSTASSSSSPAEQVTSPPASSASSTSPASSTPSSPGSGEGFVSIRDAVRSAYPHLGEQFQDDNAALQHLLLSYQQAQQYREVAPYAQQYMQHASQFQQYLAQQQQAAREAEAARNAAPGWWKAPEYNASWREGVEQDPQTGEYRVKNGFSPDILPKLREAMAHRQQFMDKFAFDPIGSIKPGIEEVARQVAQEMVQQHLGGYQSTVQANNIVEQNSSWLHARDQAGNVLVNPQTGRPALSPLGQRTAQYVVEVEKMGVTGVQQQWNMAKAMAERDLLMADYENRQRALNGQASKQQFINGAQHQPNASGAQVAAPPANPVSGGANRVMDVQERMKLKRGQAVA